MEKIFPTKVHFINEKGLSMTHKVEYECKTIKCGEYGGMGHTLEDCRQKKYELAMAKLKPRQVWVKSKGCKLN